MQHTVAGSLPFALLGVATFPSKHGARGEERLLHGSCVRHGPARSIGFAGRANGEGKLQLIQRKGGEGEKKSGAVPRALQTNLAAASQMKEQRPARGLLFLGINQELLKPNQRHPAGTGRRKITPLLVPNNSPGPPNTLPSSPMGAAHSGGSMAMELGEMQAPSTRCKPCPGFGSHQAAATHGRHLQPLFHPPSLAETPWTPSIVHGCPGREKGGFPERR